MIENILVGIVGICIGCLIVYVLDRFAIADAIGRSMW